MFNLPPSPFLGQKAFLGGIRGGVYVLNPHPPGRNFIRLPSFIHPRP